jgi:hypothetical protein
MDSRLAGLNALKTKLGFYRRMIFIKYRELVAKYEATQDAPVIGFLLSSLLRIRVARETLPSRAWRNVIWKSKVCKLKCAATA